MSFDIASSKIQYFSQYIESIPAIESHWGRMNITVPKDFVLLAPIGQNRVVVAVEWIDCRPMVFPEQIDYVITKREVKKMMGLKTVTEQGLIPFPKVAQALGNGLKRHDDPLPVYVYERHNPLPYVKKAIETAPMTPLEQFRVVDPSQL